MQLCSIVPLNNLDVVNNRKYNMLLAHLCKSKKYIEWAKDLKGYKIMDNSIIELGESFSFEDLIDCATECNVDEIVLPDVFKDPKKTIELVKSNIIRYKSMNPKKKFKLMAVCHGKNVDEFKECFKELSQIDEIQVIGIPKVVTTWCGDRSKLFDIFSNTNKEIHLLGCWKSFKELKSFSKEMKDRIRTIDTCLPALLSLETDDEFQDRNLNKTIDLENDIINKDNYMKIVSKIDNLLE